MGKATKWFRNILGLKKPDPNSSQPTSKEKRRWSSVKRNSLNERETKVDENPYAGCEAANKQAITAAGAHSAAAIVRLTSDDSGRCANLPPAYVGGRGGTRYELALAAVKIQSTFRGYLARRALRALRGLVRLQALVRGHIERKRTAKWLRRMHALLRAEARARARARAGRDQISESSHSSGQSSHFQHPGPLTPENFEHSIRSKNSKYEVSSMLKKNGSKSNCRVNGGGDELAHVSWNWTDHQMDNRWRGQKGPSNLLHSCHLTVSSEQYSHSHSFTTSKYSGEVQSLSPFTPTKSCSSQSCLSSYSNHPNYMAYTESSRAKVRSFSAPKQRPQHERSSSTQRFTALQANFTNKAYPGSGRLDGFGMPIGHK